MAPPHNSVYMDFPEEIKLQIHQNLDDSKELLKSRLVCKGFLPKELAVVISLFGMKKVTVKLNLTPGVKAYSHEELDRLAIFDNSSTVCEKFTTNLANLPASLLQKTLVLITFLSDQQNQLVQDLQLISEHCSGIKLFFFVLTKIDGVGASELNDGMKMIFAKNHENFTHLVIFPVGTTPEEEKALTFDSGSLAQCNKLSTCLITGNGSSGRNALLEVKNFDKLPNSVQTLGFYKVGCQELEWAAENLVNLNVLFLEVDESRQRFSQDLFQRLCNLPSLILMELLFTVKDNVDENVRLRELKGILQGIEQLCQAKAGIQVQIKEEASPPQGMNDNEEGDEWGVEEFTEITIQVAIMRPPFGGFGDKRVNGIRDTDDLD